jgi:Ca-activated chloride channel homolog
MSFLAPLALIGLPLIGGAIVAMYLLRLRREDRTVSSTFLWQRMIRDVEANTPWQKLRRNILLLLQLLLALALILALARPFFFTQGIAGRNLIVVLDRSASMGATDMDASRLDAAKAQARALVDQLPDGGRATLIAAGGPVEVPAAATTDRRELRRAIEGVRLHHGGGSDLSQALTLAAALAAREAESEVAVISDGNVSIPEDLQVPATVRYFPMGRLGANVAISALALTASPGGQTLFAQLTNYGDQTASRRVDIFADGTLFNAVEVNLAPAGDPAATQSFSIEVPAPVQLVEARIDGEGARPEAQQDALPLDDRAWAVSTLGDDTTIRVVTPGNRFLTVGLSLLPGITYTVAPSLTTTFTETALEVPLTILDGIVPATLPPGNLLFIAPPASTEFFSITGELEFPSVRPAPGDQPLLRNVSLSEVSVLKTARLVPSTWARTVIDSDGTPLLVAGERDGRRVAVLGFDLHNSTLPLQVAFPLLLSNLVDYLAPGAGAGANQLAPGQALAVQVDDKITRVALTPPSGSQLDLPIQNGQAVYAETDALGPYTLEEYVGEELVARQRFAVNMFAPDESRVAPRPDIAIRQTSGLAAAVTTGREGKQELWHWLAGLALALLVLEWLVYQRSGLAYLRERWFGRREQPAGGLRR